MAKPIAVTKPKGASKSNLEPATVEKLARRYAAGEKLTDLAAEVGVTWQVLAGHLTKRDLPGRKAVTQAEAVAHNKAIDAVKDDKAKKPAKAKAGKK